MQSSEAIGEGLKGVGSRERVKGRGQGVKSMAKTQSQNHKFYMAKLHKSFTKKSFTNASQNIISSNEGRKLHWATYIKTTCKNVVTNLVNSIIAKSFPLTSRVFEL